MNKHETRPLFNRRSFLKLLAAAGVTTAGGYTLAEVAPWLPVETQADQTRRPLAKAIPMSTPMHELPVDDPQDRELWISLGCAFENLLIVTRPAGYAAEVSYPDRADLIHVDLRPDTAQPSPFFDAISTAKTRAPNMMGSRSKAPIWIS